MWADIFKKEGGKVGNPYHDWRGRFTNAIGHTGRALPPSVEHLHGPKDAVHSLANSEPVNIARHDVMEFLEEAAKDGNPQLDLTEVQVEGMLIFGGNGLGIRRKNMPQVPRAQRDQFVQEMTEKGVTITEEHISPLSVYPTQSEISAAQVGRMIRKYEKNPQKEFPALLVSKDNYILDGHHHWGTMAAYAVEHPKIQIPIRRLKVGVWEALRLMHAYDKKHGIVREGIEDLQKWEFAHILKEVTRVDSKGNPYHDERGRFTSASGVAQQLELFPRDLAERSVRSIAIAAREKRLQVKVAQTYELGGGVSETYQTNLENGDTAAFKPQDEIDNNTYREEIAAGYTVEREVGAWEVAKAVGMEDLVVAAVPRQDVPLPYGDGDKKFGAMVEWADGELALYANDSYDGLHDAARAAVFDFVIGNEDRHQKNWLVTEDSKLRLIDHNLAFPDEAQFNPNNGNIEFLLHMKDMEELGVDTVPSLHSIAKPFLNRQKHIADAMRKAGLRETAIEYMRMRMEYLATLDKWAALSDNIPEEYS